MKRAEIRFTYNDYLVLPEDKRHEILDGSVSSVRLICKGHPSSPMLANLNPVLFEVFA